MDHPDKLRPGDMFQSARIYASTDLTWLITEVDDEERYQYIAIRSDIQRLSLHTDGADISDFSSHTYLGNLFNKDKT